MDLLDSVMELFNSTPSPPINVLPSSASIMEPNNLSQTAGTGAAATTTTAAAETAPATTQTNVERNLDLKLPILSSSSSDSELDEQTNPLAGTSTKAEGERAASPPPNCAICLGRCKNKCFTDSCKHQFCFKCLCEWSKVKPECPLCKQTFKSIIHNVKSKDQFEEYHVQPPTVQIAHPPFEMDFQEMRIFGVVHPGHNRNHPWNDSAHRPFFDFDFSSNSPYSSASTGGSLSTASASSSNRSIANGLRNQYVYRGELLDLYRQEYPGAIASSGTLSQLWRRYVYDRKLYAMPVADITGRFRESNARFYRDNPSQIHRLMPWINRDIVCLLRETQHDVTTVLESINSALTIMNILSPAFRRRLQPYLGTKTAHFIHELNNFARSPYDMIGYDRAVQYSPQSNNEEIIIEFTSSDDSSDNEHIDVAGDASATGSSHNHHHNVATTSSSSSSRSRSTHNGASINAINLTIHNRLTSASGSGGSARTADIPDDGILVIDLRGESDMNDTTTSTAQATTNSSTYHENVGHNAANNSEGDILLPRFQASVADNIELTSGSSDECEFVLERKPPHLRTPEMVSLDSASDSDVVFVEESKPLNKTSFSSSEGELNDNPTEHKQTTSRHHNKIAALVESKKRNQAANLVKSEQHTEVYNLGASTSAALRLSLQNRKDKSRRTDSASSSNRLRRDKYALRNNDKSSRAERPKRRGKRLDSESSHTSTSSSTTISSSSSSTTTTTNSSSGSSSDEDYVASTSQRKNKNEMASNRKRRSVRKNKKRKASSNGNRATTKRDSRKRKKYNDYSSDEDEDEDDNGHMGKNFALVMAINERKKRQNQKNSTRQTRDYHQDNNRDEGQQDKQEEDDSDGENSWRLKAVNEPLRKQQQQQQQQRNKISHKSNERKRRRKTSTNTQLTLNQQNSEEKDKRKHDHKRQKYEDQTPAETETVKMNTTNCYKTEEETSSDESDNINLIQLKTKLTGQDQYKEIQTNPTNETANDQNNPAEAEIVDTNTTTANIVTESSEIISTTASNLDYLNIPPTTTTTLTTTTNTSTTTETFNHSPLTTLAIASEMATQNMDSPWTLTQNYLLNFNDDDDIDSNDNNEHVANNINYQNDPNEQEEQQQQQEQELTTASTTVLETYQPHHHHHQDDIDEEETLMPSNIQLNNHESSTNVFVDGTSMTSTTTTTDTILHEAAEQISSAAVNFYNPQQSFNTADFAVDENSTNSSSSDSSMSSTTTSISSSSNSSSSNTQTSFTNYNGDRS